MRDEQDLLNRRKHAMLNQLTSLSALAVETAENLPDVPEMSDSEFADVVGFRADDQGSSDAEIESDPTIGSATDEAEEPAGPARTDNEEDSGQGGEQPGEVSSGAQGKSDQPPGDEEFAQESKPSAA
jgi:hypothetical protein